MALPRAVRGAVGVRVGRRGSHTGPVGYTGQGRGAGNQTIGGRILPPDERVDSSATGQFEISDERSPAEVANVLRRRGFEPVWKDWDQVLAAK